MKKEKPTFLLRLLLALLIAGLAIFILNIYKSYIKIYTGNVKLVNDVYIPSNSDFSDVVYILYSNEIIKDTSSFIWVAKRMKYPENIHSGHYVVKNGMTNKKLIEMLRSGLQEPVRLTFNNINSIAKLSSVISKQIEADSLSLSNLLTNDAFLDSLGLTQATAMSMFIPNTYEFYWTTSARKFIGKMYKEYQKFWNADRLAKARLMNLTKSDVSTLASIVDKETNKRSEMPIIAGVYVNRLKKRMQLQADPTIRFIVGEGIKRILNIHLKIESPYNTYLKYGLPPGPIWIPSIYALDAVLNYQRHDYIYFCAKEDFSGYHYFARTLREHERYAKLYRQALNDRKIWK